MYRVIFSPDAQKDVVQLKKKAPQAFKKLIRIYDDIVEVYILSSFGHYK